MLSRRQVLLVTAALVAAGAMRTPADAQQIVQIGRDSPERKPILDAVRVPVERLLGIKVVFVVERMTMFGDWAFAALHPRTEVGDRIDYRRTLIAKDFDPEQDSDFVDALVRRSGSSLDAGRARLPADRRRLGRMAREIQVAARAVPQRIVGGRDPARAPIPCAR